MIWILGVLVIAWVIYTEFRIRDLETECMVTLAKTLVLEGEREGMTQQEMLTVAVRQLENLSDDIRSMQKGHE